MSLEDDLLHDVMRECKRESPRASNSACLLRALELTRLLVALDWEWAKSQRRFFSNDTLVFYGSGTNVVPVMRVRP